MIPVSPYFQGDSNSITTSRFVPSVSHFPNYKSWYLGHPEFNANYFYDYDSLATHLYSYSSSQLDKHYKTDRNKGIYSFQTLNIELFEKLEPFLKKNGSDKVFETRKPLCTDTSMYCTVNIHTDLITKPPLIERVLLDHTRLPNVLIQQIKEYLFDKNTYYNFHKF